MRKRASHSLVQLLAALLVCVAPGLAQTSKDLPALAPLERELKGGETHSYRVLLNSNQFLHAVVEQKDIDISTAVFGPDGKQLTESDSPNDRWGSEPILWVASVAGEYRVDVRSGNSKAPAGRYEIKIIALREATRIDRDHVAAQLAFDEGQKFRKQQTAAAKRTAIEKFESALPLFEAAGDKYREALTLQSIGIALYPLNEIRQALDYMNRASALAVASKDPRLEAGIETWIGGMLDILGDVGKALNHFQRALALARAGGWRLAEGNALASIGKIYTDVADWQKALEFHNQALPLFRALGHKQNEAITLNNLGLVYFFIGEDQKALEYLQQSLPLLREVGDKDTEALTLLNIGRIQRRLGAYEKARSFYSQVQAIQKETGSRLLQGETLEEIAMAYSAEGQNEKAVEYFRQAIQIQHAAGNLRREALALNNLGDAYDHLEQPDKALEQFTPALATLRSMGDLRSAAASLEGIARAEQKRGNLAEARKNIEESLSLRETVRLRSGSLQLRASYRATIEQAYEFYIDLLMQQHAKDPAHGYDAEALAASERGRARSLLERLSEARVDIRQGVDAALLEKERALSLVLNAKAQRELQLKTRNGSPDEIAAFDRELSGLEDEYQQVQAQIRKSSPQYAALTQPRPLGLKEIQQQLDPNSMLLEYALGEERSYIWVVTTDSLKTYSLPKRAEVEKLARDVSDSLMARTVFKSLEIPAQRAARIAAADVEFQHASHDLSRMILAPVAADFGKRRLIVVADGALQYVPFAALSLANGGAYRPLVLSHEVVSLASASAFALQRHNLENRKPAPKAVAVIADPVFSLADARLKTNVPAKESSGTTATRIIEHLPAGAAGQLSIPRLPFTRSEAEQILAVAPATASLKALDFSANRTVATSGELSQYRYVHFATHGYLDTTRAGLSAIVLSLVDQEGKPLDGFLRVHDIYNLNLPAELVVLSACETGLGKDVKGEGLDGLTRAFMYAGARRLIVSLWNVNDKATAALMQRLYVEMLKSNKPPAAALRAAQIELTRTRQWQSPYYWAAFVMQGEWN
jgi:CHAT domain-containing protein/Tfp pilus assembly protein PilF